MADIIHSSEKKINWDNYWSYSSIEKELEFCRTDGLMSIFEKFLPKNGLILEAGCGLGKWVIYFRRKGFKIIGLDNSLSCLAQIKRYDKDTQIIAGKVESLPIKDNSLSAYISLGVIEHFEEGPQIALRDARRVLKKDGIIFVEVPYLNALRRIILPFKNLYRIIRKKINKEPQNYYFAEYRYTKNELKKFLKSVGFKVIFVAPKDDILPNRSIGLWLDFSFVRAIGIDESAHELNKFGYILSRFLRSISPWISCACVVCVGRKL